MSTNPAEQLERKQQALKLFSPRTPISSADLFSGRAAQIITLVHAINQPGAHAIIYGERGVGKTSLANVAPLSFALQKEEKPIVAPPELTAMAQTTMQDFGGRFSPGLLLLRQR